MHAPRSFFPILGIVAVIGGLIAGTEVFSGHETVAPPKPLALVGGRILTQTESGTVEGTVLIRDGKITAIGPPVNIPADAERIEVKDLIVTPGLIDARSSLWLTTSAARDTSRGDSGPGLVVKTGASREDWMVEVFGRGCLGGCRWRKDRKDDRAATSRGGFIL